jgi:hypothetical protein
MTTEVKEELIKWLNDTPALGAIVLTKMSNPDVTQFDVFETWAYNHGWFWLIMYRFAVIIFDVHKKLSQPVVYFDGNESYDTNGYGKIYLVVKKLLK